MVKKITFQAAAILLLASCFYFYEFIAQVAPSVLQTDLMHAFAIDATKLGLLSSCFYLSYAPLQLTSGLLLDRYSTRVILTCICVVFSLGVLLFAQASSIYMAAFARFIMGAAASCAFISVLHLIAHWVPKTKYALFTGIAEAMGGIGGLSGSWFLALLLKNFSWRIAITGLALLGFILAIFIALIIRDQPVAIDTKTQPATLEAGIDSIFANLKAITKNSQTWMIGLYSFLIWAPILGFLALYGVEFLKIGQNIDHVTAAAITSCVWLGIACSSPLIGWISDALHKPRLLMTICGLVGFISLTSVIFITNMPASILYVLMFGIGFASSGQALSFVLIKDNSLRRTNSTANGLNNMILVASGLVFQPLMGKILDMSWHNTMQNDIRVYELHSYQIAFSVLACCYLFAILVSRFFIKEANNLK